MLSPRVESVSTVTNYRDYSTQLIETCPCFNCQECLLPCLPSVCICPSFSICLFPSPAIAALPAPALPAHQQTLAHSRQSMCREEARLPDTIRPSAAGPRRTKPPTRPAARLIALLTTAPAMISSRPPPPSHRDEVTQNESVQFAAESYLSRADSRRRQSLVAPLEWAAFCRRSTSGEEEARPTSAEGQSAASTRHVRHAGPPGHR